MIKTYQQLELFGKMAFEKAVFEPPFKMIARMPNDACFYFVTGGLVNVYTPTERLPMLDEGVVLRCGNYINEILCQEGVLQVEAIAVHFYPELIQLIYDHEFPEFLLQVDQLKPVMYEKVKATKLIQKYIDNLKFYFENPELVSEELLKLKMREIILLLAKTDNGDKIKSLLRGIFSKTSFSFKNIIEANIYNNHSLQELAALCNLSLSSFKRTFKKNYAVSPAKYIKQKKLAKAVQYLTKSNLRISDIAFEVGFSDLAHFSKSFFQTYGLSPSEYRAQKNT